MASCSRDRVSGAVWVLQKSWQLGSCGVMTEVVVSWLRWWWWCHDWGDVAVSWLRWWHHDWGDVAVSWLRWWWRHCVWGDSGVILPCTAVFICDSLVIYHWSSCDQINCSRKVWTFYKETQFILEMKIIKKCFSFCISWQNFKLRDKNKC